MDGISISEWSNYLAVQGEAAATLTGLVFVAVSINLMRVISIPGLTGRAAESLIQFFGVLVISTTALVPQKTMVMLGAEILALGAALWLFQTWLQVRYVRLRTGHPRHWVVTRVVQTQFTTVPLMACGALLLSGSPAGFYWLALGLTLSLIAGVASAWVLLIEILR